MSDGALKVLVVEDESEIREFLISQFIDSGAKAIVIVENFASNLEKVLQDSNIQHIITTQFGFCIAFFRANLQCFRKFNGLS